jgi:hypothetical protein
MASVQLANAVGWPNRGPKLGYNARMKITPELIAHSKSSLNPVKERQLDLRGLQIPAIENLGAARVSPPLLHPFINLVLK